DDGDREGREDGADGRDLHATGETDAQVVDAERANQDGRRDEEHVRAIQWEDEREVRGGRHGRRGGSQDRPGQEEPRGRRARTPAEAFSREGIDSSRLRVPGGELRERIGEGIARERQEDPGDDRRRARDARREAGHYEDGGHQARTDTGRNG